MARKTYDYLFKFLLVGDSGAGKAGILSHFRESNFISTIGIDFVIKTINISGKKIKLQVWDTAGQERFRTITSAYYRVAHGILLVYDITCRETFDILEGWLKSICNHASSDISVVLVGNQQNLNAERQVTSLEANQFAQENELMFFEVNSVTGENIEEPFMECSRLILAKMNSKLCHTEADPGNKKTSKKVTGPRKKAEKKDAKSETGSHAGEEGKGDEAKISKNIETRDSNSNIGVRSKTEEASHRCDGNRHSNAVETVEAQSSWMNKIFRGKKAGNQKST